MNVMFCVVVPLLAAMARAASSRSPPLVTTVLLKVPSLLKSIQACR